MRPATCTASCTIRHLSLQLKEFEIQNKQTCRSEPTEWTDPFSPAPNESVNCNVSLKAPGLRASFSLLFTC